MEVAHELLEDKGSTESPLIKALLAGGSSSPAADPVIDPGVGVLASDITRSRCPTPVIEHPKQCNTRW